MRRLRPFSLLLSLVLLLMMSSGTPPIGSAPPGPTLPDHVPGEVLIRLVDGADTLDRSSLLARVQGFNAQTFLSNAQRWKLGPGVDVERAIRLLGDDPLVAYVEPNYVLSMDVVPNDPRLDELWGMINDGQTGGTVDADIDADMAWGVSTGSSAVIVAVIDTGVDYNHPDLAANMWTNPGEIADNGIDDDDNGYVDDVHGYDWVNDDGDPFDDNGHGTHCSGTIGAIGDNGIGVAGVNWDVTIMALKFLNAGGSGSTADAVSAVDYAVLMGATLSSNSWGGGGYSQTLYDAIAAAGAADQAFVAAAGNGTTDTDANPHYPSSYDLPNIISVAATNHDDDLASFSNWGATSVDLAAPGDDILSTLPGNSYGLLSGTSMATPHTAGVAALIKAVSPNVPVAQLKSVLLNATDHLTVLEGKVVSEGRLNAFFAIAEPDEIPPGPITDLATGTPGSNTMGLTWTATGDDGDVGTATYYEVRYSTAPIDEANFDQASLASGAPVPSESGTPEAMEVKGLDASTTYYFAIKAFDEWGNAGDLGNVPTGETLPPPTADIDPTTLEDALLTGEQSDHTVTLSNVGVGTLDFEIPTPVVGQPTVAQVPLELGKDEADPRSGDPVTAGQGGPDGFGYRWIDSDEPGGPTFAWIEISGTGLPVDATTDDDTSSAIDLDFDFPFYGQFFDSIRVCTNGWLSFTSTSTAYGNQPLPSVGAPENLVAPFWDDLNPGGATKIFYQSFGTYAVVQWTDMPRYSGPGTYTFQAILDSAGTITYQYLTLTGEVTSSTVGIQNATKDDGLQVAFNQDFLHEDMAVQIAAMPQWLTVTPTSGRLGTGESIPLNVHMDASGLEGGLYPGQVNVLNNDPGQPVLTVDVTLDVTGAPDAEVAPDALHYGDTYLAIPKDLILTVRNTGTDVLHVTDVAVSDPALSASPTVFDLAPRETQDVTVTWTPSALGAFAGTVTVYSDDAGEPAIEVPADGTAIPAPEIIVTPQAFDETLFTGQQVARVLNVHNAGGSDLIVQASADLGEGLAPVISGGTDGEGGPDAFGYRWKDSDASGGPTFDWVDISAIGTQVTFSSQDDGLSPAINMGMTFPFYGENFPGLKCSTNGWLTFDTSYSGSALYSNQSLPSSSLPGSSIALFWDDLHMRATGRVFYHFDGSKFIVQYDQVERYGAGSMLTFQVLLYPNGKIKLQYLDITGTLNSSTVGIQDSAKAIALQMAYNETYLHSGLAIQISRTPDWMTVTPSDATIPPGESFDFDVLFDATDRLGGDLTGNVVIDTNIPNEPQVLVPSTLHVIGVPVVGLVPESYAYGTRFVGYPHLTSFRVVNNGTDVLNVSAITTTDPALVVDDQPGGGDQSMDAEFPLPPGGSRLFTLRWSPTVAGPLNAEVRVASDDPVTPMAVMPVTGDGVIPPAAAWSPDSFTEDLMVGDVVHRTLRLENNGGSDLEYTSELRAAGAASVTVHDDLKLGKGEPDPREGILGSGGPDVYGYEWRDSDEAGGPVFNWFDIRDIGTPIAGLDGDDENRGPVPIGFDFPFYGETFDSIRACTNGWLSFTSSSTDLSNDPLPSSGAPENLLAVFWDDLHFRSEERATYYNDGTRFIVQYTDVDQYSPSGQSYTFQVILYPNGRIVYQFLEMSPGDLEGATIGIQNAAKDDGLTVAYNTAYVHDYLAVQFSPPLDWLNVTPVSGNVPAGGFVDLDVAIDTTFLIGGDYAAGIDLFTNDPANAVINVPVSMHVTGIPDVEASPAALTFPTTFVGFEASLQTVIRNVGTDVLHISGVEVTGDFSQTGLTPPIDLPVGGTIPVTVTFAPTTDGDHAENLVIHSNDPDEVPFLVSLTGAALIPPEVGSDPTEIHTALPPGGTRTKTLTVTNTGGSDLEWDSGTNFISTAVEMGSYLDLGKDDEDPRAGILGSGGPDAFGYTWVDSDDPGGPVFDWVDISGVGTPIDFGGSYKDDGNSGPMPIGFPFSFYGQDFTEFYVCTNGWVSFTSTKTTYSNQPLPNDGFSVPENLLAVFWDDMVYDESYGASAYYHFDGTRTILQFNNIRRIGQFSAPYFSYEIILYPNGKFTYQYLELGTTVNSHTIGIQNAARDDGLTVVYNDAGYIHENLAIEFSAAPEWMFLEPTSGVIPAGGTQDVTVTFDASEIEDGVHEATIDLTSNDPYTPLYQVPVSLNVGWMDATWVNFDPDVLNLSSNGKHVRMVVELPEHLDPYDIPLESVFLNDTVPALSHPAPAYADSDGNGIMEVAFKFDRVAVQATLPEGTDVPVKITGEVFDIQWWTGTDYIRTQHPRLTAPVGDEYVQAGTVLPIRWEAPLSGTPSSYTVQLSRDDEVTWEVLAEGVSGTALDWVITEPLTSQAIVRVIAMDRGDVMGFDTADRPFTIATATLGLPYPVDPASMTSKIVGTEVRFEWTMPPSDPTHGPVTSFRILRGTDPAALEEVAVVTEAIYIEDLSATAASPMVYYRIIATNPAGDAE